MKTTSKKKMTSEMKTTLKMKTTSKKKMTTKIKKSSKITEDNNVFVYSACLGNTLPTATVWPFFPFVNQLFALGLDKFEKIGKLPF